MNQRIKDIVNKHFSFDDEDDLQTIPKKTSILTKLQNTIYIQQNFVDLDLPSGTLWMKHNLGATCEDTPESWYGNYYMWGSTKPGEDEDCCWKNAPFNNGKKTFDKQYFEEHMHEFVDHAYNLLPEHDVAYRTNNLMHIPTKDQLKELGLLPSHWIENYNDIKGLNGRAFIGNNGNELFIPAAGWLGSLGVGQNSKQCYLWSSILDTKYTNCAYYYYVDPNNISPSFTNRYGGFSIRPVLCQ